MIIKKKIFIVKPEKVDYDQYDGVVVLAESEEEALALGQRYFYIDGEDYVGQDNVSAKKVDLNGSSEVIFTSYNAG